MMHDGDVASVPVRIFAFNEISALSSMPLGCVIRQEQICLHEISGESWHRWNFSEAIMKGILQVHPLCKANDK